MFLLKTLCFVCTHTKKKKFCFDHFADSKRKAEDLICSPLTYISRVCITDEIVNERGMLKNDRSKMIECGMSGR